MEAQDTDLVRLDELFSTEAVYEVPSVADRYRYKKVGGSSDTAKTQDVFE